MERGSEGRETKQRSAAARSGENHNQVSDAFLPLFADAAGRWRAFEKRRPGYHTYVHADWPGIVEPLRQLADHLGGAGTSFLECGSGLGVIAIVADRLGFDAYGIELEPWLFEQSLDLATTHRSRATFAHGSFVPAPARDDVAHESAEFLTVRDGEPAYGELGMQLADFDVIYAFPWPGEEDRFLDLARRYARRDAHVLLYGSTDGYQLYRRGKPVAWPRA